MVCFLLTIELVDFTFTRLVMDQANADNAPALDPSVLLPPQSHTLQSVNHTWYQPDSHYQQVSAPSSSSAGRTTSYAPNPEQIHATPTNDEQNAKTKNAQRKERRMARERERTPLNALLPDEIVPEPPHNPDDQCETPSMRPCSMAKQDVPAFLRCYVMLRPDYVYRMCESCRMKFKLAEMRKNGIRYDGKYKATEQPSEQERHDGRFKGTKVSLVSLQS